MGPKRCPNGERRNPKTGLCEKKIQTPEIPKTQEIPKKVCPPGKILNPKTNRCIIERSVNNKTVKIRPPRKKETPSPVIVIHPNFPSPSPEVPMNIVTPDSIKHISASRKILIKNLIKNNKTRKYRKGINAIRKLMGVRELGNKIRKKYLTTLCSNSGVCMALGKELDVIRKFFNGFTDFEYVVDTDGVGSLSANGFVTKITYQRDDYKSYAILKSSQGPKNSHSSPDNLVYEYEVGQYINKQCKIFPCFLETYGLYFYKNDKSWKSFRTKRNNRSKDDLLNALELDNGKSETKEFYTKACIKNQRASILIQDIDNPITLQDLLKDNYNDNVFMNITLLHILIQVYYPLAMLCETFTHYDLHSSNVLIYQLTNDEYIEYEFTDLDDNIRRFNTKYIVKIIDYGRSYFYDSPTNNSLEIYNKLCSEQKCTKKINTKKLYKTFHCGSAYGFGWLNDTNDQVLKANMYIDSTKRNVSHDLRLAHSLVYSYVKDKNGVRTKSKSLFWNKFDRNMLGILDNVFYEHLYGTKEEVNSQYRISILNVKGLCKELSSEIDIHTDQNIEYFRTSTKIGTLQIDGKTPMKFLPPN